MVILATCTNDANFYVQISCVEKTRKVVLVLSFNHLRFRINTVFRNSYVRWIDQAKSHFPFFTLFANTNMADTRNPGIPCSRHNKDAEDKKTGMQLGIRNNSPNSVDTFRILKIRKVRPLKISGFFAPPLVPRLLYTIS